MREWLEIAEELEDLSVRMHRTANRMLPHGGRFEDHGEELVGASEIARGWAAAIRQEVGRA